MKRRMIFGLMMLTMFMSGCTVEVPTPIPTTNRLTVLSDVTGEVEIRCVNYSRDDDTWAKYFNVPIVETRDGSRDLSRRTKQESNTVNYGDMAVIETIVYPDILYNGYRMLLLDFDTDSFEECEIEVITIDYHMKKYIDNQIVIDEHYSKRYYGDWDDICEHNPAYPFYRCIDDIFHRIIDMDGAGAWRQIIEDY